MTDLRESIVNKLWADTELHHEDAGPIADAVLDLVTARLAEVEAERDALRSKIAEEIRAAMDKIAVRAEVAARVKAGTADEHPLLVGMEFAARIAEGTDA